MEYTVYVLGPEVKVAEAGAVAPVLPDGALAVLVTTSREEAASAVSALVLEHWRWDGNEWLPPASRCGKCGHPVEPGGQGGSRHAEFLDAVACEAMHGGGMLRSLLGEED